MSTANGTTTTKANPVLIVARGVLRRRWHAMLLAGTVLAGVMAAAAYKAARPEFTAGGMIRVAPALPRVIYGNEENQQLPFYDVFLNAQMALVVSRPVLERAVEDPALQKAGWPQGPDGVALLSRQLKVVKGGPRSELVEITVAAGHPLVCTAAVNAVLDAFERISWERQEQTTTVRERALEQRLGELDAELKDLTDRLTTAAGEYGADNLERVHLSRVEDLQKLDEKIRGLDRTIAEQRAKMSSPAGAEESDADTRRMIALDHTMGNLIVRRLEARTRFDTIRTRCGPSHPAYREAEAALQLAEEAVRARVDQMATLGKTGVLGQSGAADEGGLASLMELRKNMDRVREEAAAGTMELDRRKAEVQRLLSRRTQLQEMIAETKRRRDQMYVENTAQLPGRVSVAVRGMVPVAPSKDKRKPFATGGAMAGLLLGAALAALPGLLRPRVGDPSELGLLGEGVFPAPALPDVRPEDARSRRLASHQVSMLRTVLDQSRDAETTGPVVVTVVSADRGEGKTNLSLALGRAFASAGRRTLLVDADLAHAGLSHALSLQEQPGLREHLGEGAPGTLSGTCVSVGPRLSVLTAGRASSPEAPTEALSRAALHKLVASMGSGLDVVVIDTPSLSAAPDVLAAAALADHVVLVVREGQRLSRARAVADRVSRLCGGRCHAVLNRASRVGEALVPDEVLARGPFARPAVASVPVVPEL